MRVLSSRNPGIAYICRRFSGLGKSSSTGKMGILCICAGVENNRSISCLTVGLMDISVVPSSISFSLMESCFVHVVCPYTGKEKPADNTANNIYSFLIISVHC